MEVLIVAFERYYEKRNYNLESITANSLIVAKETDNDSEEEAEEDRNFFKIQLYFQDFPESSTINLTFLRVQGDHTQFLLHFKSLDIPTILN